MLTARPLPVLLALAALLTASLLAPPGGAAQIPTPPLPFVAIDPCRLVDTRGNGFAGPFGPPGLAAGAPRDFPLVGQCGLPPGTLAVSLNVTATNTLGPGFFLLHPAGGATPLVSTLNYLGGETVANAALAPLGPGGLTVIAGVSGADLILDVNGYFVSAGGPAPTTFQGPWASGTSYGVNDLVSFGGLTYVSLVDSNTGNTPATSPAQWALFTGSYDAGGGTFQVTTVGTPRVTVTPGGDLTLTGTLTLPAVSSATAGTVFKGASRFLHTAGTSNTFLGVDAGNFTGTGFNNTGVGLSALQSLTTGVFNTATGVSALQSNTTGNSNTALGIEALLSNTMGNFNTATGRTALAANSTGANNTATGASALESNTMGDFNTATGGGALASNATGMSNTATGVNALLGNVTGSFNTAVGVNALQKSTGSSNTALGIEAGLNATTGDNNIYIVHGGVAAESATTRVGTAGLQTRTFVAGIWGVTTEVAGAVPVLIDSAGQLGTVSSSRRTKEAIEPMGAASQGLLRLRPVAFRYRQPAADGTKPRQYGLIAEEVAEVYPDLIAYTPDGQPETVLYHVLPALLVNELQRQQRELLELRRRLEALEGPSGRSARSVSE